MHIANRLLILAPDILRREADVNHGCLDVAMPHQVHQSGQRDPRAYHTGSKAVSKAVRVGQRHLGQAAMMTKKGAQTGGGYGASALPTLEAQENIRRVDVRPFSLKVALQDLHRVIGQGQNPLFVPFPTDTKLAFGKAKLFEAKPNNLAGAQAVKQHQGGDTQIPISAEARPELRDFLRRERNNHTMRLPQTQAADPTPRSAKAKRAARRMNRSDTAAAMWELTAKVESIEAAHHRETMVDGLRRGRGK